MMHKIELNTVKAQWRGGRIFPLRTRVRAGLRFQLHAAHDLGACCGPLCPLRLQAEVASISATDMWRRLAGQVFQIRALGQAGDFGE